MKLSHNSRLLTLILQFISKLIYKVGESSHFFKPYFLVGSQFYFMSFYGDMMVYWRCMEGGGGIDCSRPPSWCRIHYLANRIRLCKINKVLTGELSNLLIIL